MRKIGMRKIGWTGRQRTMVMWTLVAALPLFLGACTYVPDWADPTVFFESDEAPTKVAQRQSQSSGSDSFPNLASVPEGAPKLSTPATRAVLLETLAADRANAEYTDQKLVADMGPGVSAAKMPPATQIELPSQAPASVSPKSPKSPKSRAPAAEQVAEAPAAQPESSEPTKTAFRFTQFDTEIATKPADVPAALNSELVAIVYFSYGSTALNLNDREILRDVVALQKQRGGTVRVVGHASARTGIVNSVRHRLANFETSLQRANAVASQLVRLGVARDKVATEAKADSQPIYHEFMPTGEAGNRRAEIFLEN
ncbi:MAG: OmpA family protein [Alphaproteobacteria bacterium]